MEVKKDMHFTGERALFQSKDVVIENCLFDDGESPLKESENIQINNSTFGWKYPLWYCNKIVVDSCKFLEMSRSGIWYTNDSTFTNLDIIAPKLFRRCNNIKLKNSIFHGAKETFWTCNNVEIENITIKNGDYFSKDTIGFRGKNINLEGNYFLDGGKNIEISDSKIISKDAFWNCENVTLKNCIIEGEYFGWNSKNIYLDSCTIISHQGFCYIDNLKMKNCTIKNSDLIFEYCTNCNIDIAGNFIVKNPTSGKFYFANKQEIILDENARIEKDNLFIKNGKTDEIRL